MNAPPPSDEFDAARAVVDLLKSLRPEEQARALRWAREKLGMESALRGSVAEPFSPPVGAALDSPTAGHELTGILSDPTFVQRHAAVDKMLYLLGEAHRLKPRAFENVLAIRGRNRRYFAKSEAEILKSGKSTQPRKIPGTDYWVMTNSPTPQKRDLLRRALELLGFSKQAVTDAVATVV